MYNSTMTVEFKKHQPEIKLEEMVSATDESGKRHYNSPKGKYPSVTTVVGWEKSEFFKKWRQENPKESKRVLRRGTDLHNLIESYLSNEEISLMEHTPDVSSLFVQLKPYLNKINNIHALEAPLWSDTLKVAGRVDCVAEYDGELCVIDFKGSTREKREEDVENYMLQATAYSIMWHERTGVPINKFVILMANENGVPFQIFEGTPIDYVPSLYKSIKKYYERFK
jgi:ATP-dependent exoDNAse (exonuclease V) beta subunit